jgi:hypothetical protein
MDFDDEPTTEGADEPQMPNVARAHRRSAIAATAAVHVAARRILSRRCELLGPHDGAIKAHTIDGEVLLLCEGHAPAIQQGDTP